MRRREWWKQKKNQIQKIQTTTKAKNKNQHKGDAGDDNNADKYSWKSSDHGRHKGANQNM